MRPLNKTLVADLLLAVLVLSIFPMFWALSILKPAATREEVFRPEANKALIQRALEEVLNNGDLAAADEIFASNFRQHAPNLPTVTLGSEGIKLVATLYRSAFFNLRYTVEDMSAEGDKVVIRWSASGLYIRAFDPYAPSGRQAMWTGVTIYRIANGQIVEAWTYHDRTSSNCSIQPN